MDRILYNNICNSTAHRPSREANAHFVLAHPELFPDLLEIALIRTLFQMGKWHAWIYSELIPILQQGFPHHSPAYKAVAKEVVAKIKS